MVVSACRHQLVTEDHLLMTYKIHYHQRSAVYRKTAMPAQCLPYIRLNLMALTSYALLLRNLKYVKHLHTRREGPRSNLKIMENFTKKIIESQENLLTKTIEEQRKLDQEILNQYNYIFLQQTQMLLTGLQNLNSPLPTNYPTVQQFPRISTIPPMNPIFTETLLPQNNNNTAHPYTSPWHEMQTRPKPDQTEKTLPKLTTILPAISIRPNIIPYQPLVQNPSSSSQVSTIRQSESLSRPVLEEDEDNSDIEYEQVEHLDGAQND